MIFLDNTISLPLVGVNLLAIIATAWRIRSGKAYHYNYSNLKTKALIAFSWSALLLVGGAYFYEYTWFPLSTRIYVILVFQVAAFSLMVSALYLSFFCKAKMPPLYVEMILLNQKLDQYQRIMVDLKSSDGGFVYKGIHVDYVSPLVGTGSYVCLSWGDYNLYGLIPSKITKNLN